MIDFLINKIENYENPSKHLINQGEYYIEYIEEGILMLSPGSAVLFQDNGKIFRLGNRVNSLDWDVHCRLYDAVSKHNIRIEIPLLRESITVKEVNLDYTVVQRPNGQLGCAFLDQFHAGNINKDYFVEYISHVTATLTHIVPLIEQCNIGYPTDLLAPYKRNKDTLGYFWIDFKRWNLSKDQFYEKKIRTLYLLLLTLKDIEPRPIMLEAEKQWKDFFK